MKSKSEKTFGSRAENANKLCGILKAINGYDPGKDGLYIADYQAMINNILLINSEIAVQLHEYSSAVENRQKLYKKDPDSVYKIMRPLRKAAKLALGKSSKENAEINRMIGKITGATVTKNTKEPSAKFVSQSERSFGSIIQNLSNIIDTLEQHGEKYSSTKSDVTLPTLKEKLAKMKDASPAVTTAYTMLALKRDDRATQYDKLSETTELIKDAIDIQFGVASPEYKLVKGIKV